ncbi:YegP family protein [Afifella pfennigii]|uniref:YegP family protein n=1 Tax=Afifella pfennigii TaxID=209897 RepID=UPI00047CAB50|nr:DUF1508 domain-containing protein [Afifella pfennigii]
MATTTGYYEVYRSGGQWRWRFKANNHEIIAHGESYWNKSDCLNAIGLVKGSYNAPVYDA